MKKKVLGPASTTPNSEILPTAWGIHVTKMKQDLVDDVYPDMMSIPLAGLMEDNVQIVTYLFRKTKTSDFFDGNIRTFEAKHPYFCPKKSDVLLFPDRYIAFSLPPPLQKKFLKISYISYTTTPDALYLLMISGEGLGVGYGRRV